MASAISRAREEALKGGGGDYLDNDTLIANQQVFGIVDVVDDRGGGFEGKDRWQVKVEPYDENEDEPEGIITLSDNPSRRKFMVSLQTELNDLESKGEDVFIGPVVLVKLKGKNYRYIEIVDWDSDNSRPIYPQGAVPAGASVSEEMRPRRPRGGRQAESEPEENGQIARPSFAEAVEAKAEAAPVPVEAAYGAVERAARGPIDGEFPSIKEWALANGYDVPKGRGRVKGEIKEAYEKAKAASTGTGDYSESDPAPAPTRRRAPKAESTASSEKPSEPRTRPAQVGAGAPARAVRPPQSGAESAQEMTFQPGMAGRSTEPCADCGQHIEDRIFPTSVPGVYALIHTCPSTGEQAVMEAIAVVPEIEE